MGILINALKIVKFFITKIALSNGFRKYREILMQSRVTKSRIINNLGFYKAVELLYHS